MIAFPPIDFNSGKWYSLILEYNSKSDCELVNLWKLHQKMCQKINDYNWVAYHVCEDLLRQRGNTYMQYNICSSHLVFKQMMRRVCKIILLFYSIKNPSK